MRVRLNVVRLQHLVAESSLSQNHWAMKVGLSRGHWSGIVQGKHVYVSAKTRERILEAFGVSLDELFEIERGDGFPGESSANFQAAISDRFMIDREIGQGGMGTVYLARDVRHGRQVAVKVINQEVVSGIGSARFLKEIRVTARLEHENILTLLDSGEAAEHPYFVMPFVRGGSLREYLQRNGPLSLEDTVVAVRGISRALSYAHGERMIHCDIKPENVLRTPDGHYYVADFGISRTVHAEMLEWRRRGEIDSSAGTPAYVSPEQAAGDPDLDARSDVYSLACMVFEMLSGAPPFEGRTTMEVVSRRFTDAIPDISKDVPSVPVATARVLERAMEIDRARRFDSVAQFAAELERSATERHVVVETAVRGWFAARAVLARVTGRSGPGTARRAGGAAMRAGRLWTDVAYALRGFRKKPGFALVAILTLGLGIGVNASLFALVNGIFLRDTIVAEPDRVVEIHRVSDRNGRYFAISHTDANDIIENAGDVYSGVSKFRFVTAQLGPLDSPGRLVGGELVSHNYFDVLRVPMSIGRGFLPDEDLPASSPPVAVISHGVWVEFFNADSTIFDRPVRINGKPYDVVGVSHEDFVGRYPGISADLWLPMSAEPHVAPNNQSNNNIYAVARLRDGVGPEAARTAMRVFSERLDRDRGRERGWEFAGIVSSESILQPDLDSSIKSMAALLMAIAAIVLLVTCTNLAGFLLARSSERGKEVAVRLALGASRARVVRQMLTESVLLGAAGGVVGIAFARVVAKLLASYRPPFPVPLAIDASVDGTVLFFTLAVSVLAGVVFGLIPASQASNPELATALRAVGGGTGTRARLRWRRWLVSAQVAMSLLLLITAGLFVRSLGQATNVDVGFSEEPAAIVSVDLRGSGYSVEQWPVVRTSLTDAIASLAGVSEVAAAGRLPLELGNDSRSVNLPGRPAEDRRFVEYGAFTPEFFDLYDIEPMTGAVFAADNPASSPPVVISEATARMFFPDAGVVGRSLVIGGNDAAPATVVGVVPSIKIKSLTERPRPFLYLPMDVFPTSTVHLVARGEMRDQVLVEIMRNAVLSVNPNMFITAAQTLDAQIGIMYYLPRMAVRITVVFSLLALLLSSIGLFGVVSHNVASRTREIGIRVSLGATETSVVRLMVLSGVRMVVVGTLFGAVVGILAGNLIQRFLLDVSGTDPATLIATIGSLVVVSLLAAYVPARRVTRVNPVEALRAE